MHENPTKQKPTIKIASRSYIDKIVKVGNSYAWIKRYVTYRISKSVIWTLVIILGYLRWSIPIVFLIDGLKWYFRLRLIAGINWTKRYVKFNRPKAWPLIWPRDQIRNISVSKHYNTNSGSPVLNGLWKVTIITWTHFQVYFRTIKHFQHSPSSLRWYEIKDLVKLLLALN